MVDAILVVWHNQLMDRVVEFLSILIETLITVNLKL